MPICLLILRMPWWTRLRFCLSLCYLGPRGPPPGAQCSPRHTDGFLQHKRKGSLKGIRGGSYSQCVCGKGLCKRAFLSLAAPPNFSPGHQGTLGNKVPCGKRRSCFSHSCTSTVREEPQSLLHTRSKFYHFPLK